MTVNLLYFGVLKDLLQSERHSFELPEHSTVADLLKALRSRAEADLPIWNSLAVGVNKAWATPDTPLRQDDEVALLPPVSGGTCAR